MMAEQKLITKDEAAGIYWKNIEDRVGNVVDLYSNEVMMQEAIAMGESWWALIVPIEEKYYTLAASFLPGTSRTIEDELLFVNRAYRDVIPYFERRGFQVKVDKYDNYHGGPQESGGRKMSGSLMFRISGWI